MSGRTPNAHERINRTLATEDAGITMTDASILLSFIGPDLYAPQHREDLARALGWECAAAGCTRQARALALCRPHYTRFRQLLQASQTPPSSPTSPTP